MNETLDHGRSPGLWAGLFLASAAAVAGLRLSGAIEGGAAFLLFLIPMALLLPLYRSLQRQQSARGCGSPAAISYNRRMMLSTLGYVLGLGIAIWAWRHLEPGTQITFFLAMLPIVPVLSMIYAMGRYVVEERDEYLRHRAIMASLVGLGLVLSLGSFWGFLETFELVPHVPGWWTVPVWAMGMGLAQIWMSRRAS